MWIGWCGVVQQTNCSAFHVASFMILMENKRRHCLLQRMVTLRIIGGRFMTKLKVMSRILCMSPVIELGNL